MKYMLLALTVSLFSFQVSASTEYEITAEDVYQNLDCAGTVGQAGSYHSARMSSANSDNFKALRIKTNDEQTPKNLSIGKLETSSDSVTYKGQSPAFVFTIEKFGVHGAHNAVLKLSDASGEKSYHFECYF